MTVADLWVCVHESGHAVAHIVVNGTLPRPETIVRSLTVVRDPEDGFLGHTRVATSTISTAHFAAVRCLAGYAAEFVYVHGLPWCIAEAGRIGAEIAAEKYDEPDLVAARIALAPLAAPDLSYEIFLSWRAAVALVVDDWPALLGAAETLRIAATMSGEAFEAAWRARRAGAPDPRLFALLGHLAKRSRAYAPKAKAP